MLHHPLDLCASSQQAISEELSTATPHGAQAPLTEALQPALHVLQSSFAKKCEPFPSSPDVSSAAWLESQDMSRFPPLDAWAMLRLCSCTQHLQDTFSSFRS
eukprot:Amastigsp_a508780_875.p3 type:complete len:102 gc:universal Amastigsp_a508780_875:358-53(-)